MEALVTKSEFPELCSTVETLLILRKKSDKRSREKKRLSREVASLRKEVQDVYRNNERGIKVAKILQHIDNID